MIRRMKSLRMDLPSVAPHRRAGKSCLLSFSRVPRVVRCCSSKDLSRAGRVRAWRPRLYDAGERHFPSVWGVPVISIRYLLRQPGGPAAVLPGPRLVRRRSCAGGATRAAGRGDGRWREGQRCPVGAVAEPGHPDPGERPAARRSAEETETAARCDPEGQGKRGWGAGADRRYPDQPGEAVPGRQQPDGALGRAVPGGGLRAGSAHAVAGATGRGWSSILRW